jgi:hypothetical protein
MKILSFDTTLYSKLEREEITGLFNLFKKNIVNTYDITSLKYYIVPREYEMRLDRISEFLYGSPNYVEELMVLNNILNPYSIKQGQYIYFCDLNEISKLYTKDELSDEKEKNRNKLLSSNRKDKKISENDNKNLPLTIKPSNLEQIKVSDDFTVQIINKFE